MDLEKIKKFIELAKESGVAGLEYENNGEKISVSINTSSLNNQNYAHLFQVETPATQNVLDSQERQKAKDKSSFYEVKSPFVGTFYASPSPNDAHFVKVGDRITKGQVLCILEAMKIMNEIESEVSGEIIEICVENEGLVEYNQTLFLVKTI